MKEELREVYDGFAKTYEENRGLFDMSEVLDAFYSRLTVKQGNLLDLGCGAGVPVVRYFLDRDWTVTGVDFSEKMLELASKYVPEMDAIHADIGKIDFEPDQFDGITASYSLFHIPSEEHVGLFENFYKWLRPAGKALFTYASKEYTGSEEFAGYKTFMDKELFYSHKAPGDLRADLEKIGFAVEGMDNRTIGGETFLWITVGKGDDL